MARFDNASAWNRPTGTYGAAAGAEYDAGLRKHLLSVYNYMASGLVLTGLVALLVASSPALMQAIFGTSLRYIVMLAPLAFVLVMSFGANRMSAFALQMTFWAYAAAMGLSLSTIFVVYTGTSIASTFFITAATFGAMSLWGYTTRRDLSGFGNFLFMGLIGIVIAGVVNIFLHSSGLQMMISVLGVLIFTGLTAYDTQRIKETYSESWGAELLSKLAVMGALTLYLDFINIFLMLLQLFGDRQR